MTPAWILDIFAAIMLVVAAVSAARLVAARPWQRGAAVTDTDISHLLMGIAMAGMLAPSLSTLPNDAWAGVFCALVIWFGYRVVRDYRANGARALAVGHCAPHLVHSAAMVYMFLAIKAPAAGGGSGMGGMSGMSTLSVPTLAFLFALILAGYTIWDLDQLSSLRRGLAAAVAGAASPALVGAAAGTARTVGAVGTEVGPEAVAGSGAGGVPAADLPAGSGQAGQGGTTGGGRSRLLPILNSPGTVVGCRIAMGVTMALMLILMI
jgi:Domain of unknown function (DUF5134)